MAINLINHDQINRNIGTLIYCT